MATRFFENTRPRSRKEARARSLWMRPALLLFSVTGFKTAASISARKLSNGTTRAIISNEAPPQTDEVYQLAPVV
jgi:hypothetical protein